MPSEDAKEVATEGQDRTGSYVIRKGHFVLTDSDSGPLVPRPHRMAYKRLRDEKIVFLVRDPRDICISGAWHWRQSPADFLDRMIKGDVAKCGRWDEYVYEWAYKHRLNFPFSIIFRYKDLAKNTMAELDRLLPKLMSIEERRANGKRMWDAIKRQSFASRAAGKDEQELRRNNMRKGVVGDWRNHFTSEMNDKIWNEFGWIMERLGYERDN